MVHSIELLFDADTEATLRRIWDDLSAADLPSRAPGGRPHVTLAVAERIEPDVDALLRPVALRLPLPCTVGAPVLFGQSNAVLARLIVPSAALLALHADVHRICAPHLLPGPLPHSLPDEWTAHVTLARRVEGAHVGPVLRLAGQSAEIRGTFAGLRRWDGSQRVEHPIG
jgi:2'-5' RNA ligase